jgi:hypothetical protein
MKRALILLCLFMPAAATGISVWAVRSRAAATRMRNEASSPGRIVVPKGTYVRVKLLQGISAATKPGDMLQGVTLDPVLIDGRMVIPANTRAAMHVGDIQKRRGGLAEATVQLRELSFTDRTVAVHTAPVVATLERISDIDLMSRAAGGLLGGAIGAAGGAALHGDPSVVAGGVGGMTAGQEGGEDSAGLLRFQLVETVDLTGIAW